MFCFVLVRGSTLKPKLSSRGMSVEVYQQPSRATATRGFFST